MRNRLVKNLNFNQEEKSRGFESTSIHTPKRGPIDFWKRLNFKPSKNCLLSIDSAALLENSSHLLKKVILFRDTRLKKQRHREEERVFKKHTQKKNKKTNGRYLMRFYPISK
jgi:hypothetical protein